MLKTAIIYCLKDPISNKIRYIGKTGDDLKKRLSIHIGDAKSILNGSTRRKNNKRYSWIISLLNKSRLPIIEEVERVLYSEKKEWVDREKYWIEYFLQKGELLCNMTNGGDGGSTNFGRKFGPPSEETRLKISNNTKLAMNNELIKNKCKLGNRITHSKIFIDGKLRKDLVKKISIGTQLWWDNRKNKEKSSDVQNSHKINHPNI